MNQGRRRQWSLRARIGALAWMVLFAGMHVYWELGGTIGFGDAEKTTPEVGSMGTVALTIAILLAFSIGLGLIVLSMRPDQHRPPAWVMTAYSAIASIMLCARGMSGLIDTWLRETGLADRGISGLTYQQIYGVADPNTETLWASHLMDINFIAGGILFGLLFITRDRARAAPREARATHSTH
ncbi:DUF3995 domain-containing protein [Hoyosella altamirensis]|uniref:DUF3995 domain-containing protein n=1 Tax=Hoyosella altamirensis TaxID=616997 RepID=A0A839RUX8_9ACTN|nr:DUF3995 domain-containing protein [Hoyosella altamirensis]MBB3040028.1 hypothetical protein [Hoyosella altamirensis]